MSEGGRNILEEGREGCLMEGSLLNVEIRKEEKKK